MKRKIGEMKKSEFRNLHTHAPPHSFKLQEIRFAGVPAGERKHGKGPPAVNLDVKGTAGTLSAHSVFPVLRF
jgi:hypothetical protein